MKYATSAVESATRTTLAHGIASMARNNRTISKNVLTKKPSHSSSSAKPSKVANVAPMRIQPSLGIGCVRVSVSAPRRVCTNKQSDKTNTSTSSVLGKNPVCGTRMLPKLSRPASKKKKIARHAREPATTILARLMLEKLSMAHRRRGNLRVSSRRGVIMLARKLLVCDVGDPRHLGPFAFFLGEKLCGFRRTEVFHQGLSLFDIGERFGILQTFVDHCGN